MSTWGKIAHMQQQQTETQETPLDAWRGVAARLVGQMPDSVIARQLGVSQRQVFYIRTKLGIAAACRARWIGNVTKQLGVLPDTQIAASIGVSVTAVRNHRRKLEMKHERQGMPPQAIAFMRANCDVDTAIEFGRSISTVRAWRRKEGIKHVRKTRRPWKPKEIKQLGTMPDDKLGRLLVRRPSDVRKKRVYLGIAQFQAA